MAVTATAAAAKVLGPPWYDGLSVGLVREALLNGEGLGPVSGPTSVPSFRVITVTRTVVEGGMPGWRIALIAAGAALVTATLAVLVDRAWAAHGRVLPIVRRDGHRVSPGGVLELDESPQDVGALDLLEQTGISVRAEWLSGVYKYLRLRR
jgi:hypothetical protein